MGEEEREETQSEGKSGSCHIHTQRPQVPATQHPHHASLRGTLNSEQSPASSGGDRLGDLVVWIPRGKLTERLEKFRGYKKKSPICLLQQTLSPPSPIYRGVN